MMPYIALSIATGLAGIALYIYFLRKGQFEDVEEVKYQLFREEEKKAFFTTTHPSERKDENIRKNKG